MSVREDLRAFFKKIGLEVREYVSAAPAIQLISLGLLILIGIVIRLMFLAQPMGYDESITVVRFSQTLRDAMSDYSIPNNHVFHSLLVYLSAKLFGISPIAVRLPALVAGILVVPVSFWLLRRLFDSDTALMAAGLTAVAPAAVEYSAQARGYTLLTLFFLIAFVFATYLKEQSSITAWAMFVVAIALGFYTVPTMLYGFGLITLWLLLAASRSRRFSLWWEVVLASVVAASATLFLYLPAIARMGFSGVLGNQQFHPLPFLMFLKKNGSNAVATAQCWTGALGAPIAIVLTLSVIAGILFSWRRKRATLYTLVAMFFGIVPIICMQRVAPFPRVFNFLFPIIVGFVSYGISSCLHKLRVNSDKSGAYVWAALVVVLSVYWGVSLLMIPNLPFPGAVGISQCVEGYFVDGQAIINDMKSTLRQRDALVAYEYSGIVETTQFYLLSANRPYTLVHAYVTSKGLKQLDKYDQLFVVTLRPLDNQGRLQPMPNENDVFTTLDCPEDDFKRIFERPQLISSYQVSDLYRLQRKVTSAATVHSQQ